MGEMSGSCINNTGTNIPVNSGSLTFTDTKYYHMIPMDYSVTWTVSHADRNPHVPDDIYVNEEAGVTVVKWGDKEIKITCDGQDTFSPDVAFALAFTYKMFGGKSKFKEKWWEIISRRIKWVGNVRKAEKQELARREAVKLAKKKKVVKPEKKTTSFFKKNKK